MDFRSIMKEFIPDLRDQKVTTALKKLVSFSLAIILVPLGSMFLSKRYIFEGVFEYNSKDSILYAAIVAVVLVHVVLGGFIYQAYTTEEPGAEPPAWKPKEGEKTD